MCIERRRVNRKLAPPSFYYYLVTRENGRRKRTYVPLINVLVVMEMLGRRKLKNKHKERSAKVPSAPLEKRFYPEPLRHIMQSAGYKLQGARMHISWERFLTKAAASVRFSMLEPEYRIAVGSSENLLRLNRKAYSLLKRRNRYEVKTSYLECMSEVCTVEQSAVTSAVS